VYYFLKRERERGRNYSRRAGESEKCVCECPGKSERHFIWGGEESTVLLEGSQNSPVRPSDKSVLMKIERERKETETLHVEGGTRNYSYIIILLFGL
jgi:hypothetical protein